MRLLRYEFVGPQVGEDLAEQGGLAMLFATIMIFIYVMLRARLKVLPLEQWSVRREFLRRLKKAFVRAGMEIPYPRQTVRGLEAARGESLNPSIGGSQ